MAAPTLGELMQHVGIQRNPGLTIGEILKLRKQQEAYRLLALQHGIRETAKQAAAKRVCEIEALIRG